MTWEVATTVPRPVGVQAPAPNTVFYSFCAQMDSPNSTIGNGGTYTIGSIINPVVGQVINKAGNTLQNTQGIFLFDQWSKGNIAQNQNDAAAVQVALWLGEGYTESTITSDGGYSSGQLSAAESLGASLLTSLGYSTSWRVSPNDVVVSYTNGQDQFVDPNAGSVPEPASFVIWGVGLGLTGVATVAGTKKTKGWKGFNHSPIGAANH